MRDGKRQGTWRFWDADGSLNAAWSGEYRDGVKVEDDPADG